MLFADSVKRNILYGRPDATDEDIDRAAGQSHSAVLLPLHAYIKCAYQHHCRLQHVLVFVLVLSCITNNGRCVCMLRDMCLKLELV